MSTTLAKIAKYTGTSISTVSAALRSNPSTVRISKATREKIRDAAKQLGYRPSHSARALKTGRTNVLGLITGEIHTPFYGELADILVAEAREKNYNMQIGISHWNRVKAEDTLNGFIDGRCDGIIIHGNILEGSQYFDYIKKNKIPIIFLDTISKDFSYVCRDFSLGFGEAIEYLESKNRLNTAFVGENLENISRIKIKQLLDTFKKYGRSIKFIECKSSPLDAFKIAEKIVKERNIPDSIIVENETMAMALYKGLTANGVKIPEEISLIGHNDTAYASLYSPALTTIGYDKVFFAKKSISRLLDNINNGENEKSGFMVPTYLIKREST
jgi:DNA-binding LacI/PurR family transcriptional regulator